jgi:hypothetical protein
MINIASKTDTLVRPEAVTGTPLHAPVSVSQRSADTERLSAANQEILQAALADQPEVRPEIVEQGQRLAVDGNYPPKEIIRRLTEMLVTSVDYAEQAES